MSMITKKDFLLLFVLLLSVAVLFDTTYAQSNNKSESNKKVKVFVEYKLLKDNLMKDNNITVKVNKDMITLTGIVPTLSDKEKAGEETQNVDESYKLVNNLKVASTEQPDSIVVSKVLKRIRNSAFYSVFNWVGARDSSGVVTLYGWVHMPWYRNIYQREAGKIPGVKRIVNKIKNTFGPDEIGIRAARLIYSDPTSMFNGWQYFSNPPIHIIETNGSIILIGTVPVESVEYWAVNLVTFRTDAVNVINDLKVQS